MSLVLWLTGGLPMGAAELGFIPARSAVDGAADGGGGFAIPFLLTPLTATLVHGGIAHLLLNMLMLVYCGRQVEAAIGPAALGVLYLVGAYAAAAVQWAFDPQSVSPMIGASGAISAVVAVYALFYGERRARAIGPIPAGAVHVLWLAAAWIGLQLLIGVAGFGGVAIAVGAHIGGFLAGLVLARPLLLWRYRNA